MLRDRALLVALTGLVAFFPLTAALLPTPQQRLYQDQQGSFLRRALVESALLQPRSEALQSKVRKDKGGNAGRGFGVKSEPSVDRNLLVLAREQAKEMKRDGVVRIDNCLSEATSKVLRSYVLAEEAEAKEAVSTGKSDARSRFGVELERKGRSDLLLSLLQPPPLPAVSTTAGAVIPQGITHHPVATAMNELLGREGKMRALYEELVGKEAALYELAATITHPGSDRQMVHPDLPHREKPPLFVVFVALQDISLDMGPTTFLLGTHTAEALAEFKDAGKKDTMLAKANPRLATLRMGDGVVFDAQILHCGNANDPEKGSVRAMFNFSFRNPKITGDLGYKGSIRPGYEGKLTLDDVETCLARYAKGLIADPFAKYGNGLLGVS